MPCTSTSTPARDRELRARQRHGMREDLDARGVRISDNRRKRLQIHAAQIRAMPYRQPSVKTLMTSGL